MSLYKIKKKDIKAAGMVLAKAFEQDPVWAEILKDESFKSKCKFWESPIIYGLKYGEVYAPTDKIEGVIVWLPGKYSVMNIWTIIASKLAFRLPGVRIRKILEIDKIMKPFEVDKLKKMREEDFLYLYVVGMLPEFQGKGFGKSLIQAYIDACDAQKIKGYLETATKKNVAIYEKFGFKLTGMINHPIINIEEYKMQRDI